MSDEFVQEALTKTREMERVRTDTWGVFKSRWDLVYEASTAIPAPTQRWYERIPEVGAWLFLGHGLTPRCPLCSTVLKVRERNSYILYHCSCGYEYAERAPAGIESV